ncbi:WD40-repeat-containing domain protein [Trametes gibbosa]|nr:WD40-repeat-containing domain protein [Trametes gibbosa]
MKANYKFSNLCGTVYRQGNIVFTPDGNSVLSPVGNRVSVFDLVNNKSHTFAFENRKNIAAIALSPDANVLLSVDEDGRALLVNFKRGAVLHHFNFQKPVRAIKFSPDGKYIAVSHDSHVQVWRTPNHLIREFAPFNLHRTYTGHHDEVLSIEWSPDSKCFITTSRDMTARLFTLDPVEGFRPKTFAGHKDAVLNAFFSADGKTIYTVSRDGAVFTWKAKPSEPDSESDDEEPVASTSTEKISSVAINPSGEWLAFGGKSWTLLVWEWQSESSMWNTSSGFCFVTFPSTPSDIGVLFLPLDGTMRPLISSDTQFPDVYLATPVQFSCLAVDPSGEVIAAGLRLVRGLLWSVQTGKLSTGSWDKSVRVWSVFGDRAQWSICPQSDVLSVAFRPDGKELAVSNESHRRATRHLRGAQGGRPHGRVEQRVGKAFNSLAYTADGRCIIAGGNSKSVVIYDKFQISQNLSLDGTEEFLDSRRVTEAGNIDLIDDRGDASDLEDRMDTALPGAQHGDMSKRRYRQEARTKCVRFAPTGRAWAAASTEGLLIYSVDESTSFDPFDLDIELTPQAVLAVLARREHLKALVMAFRLNERPLVQKAYESVPRADIRLVARGLPVVYVAQLLRFVAEHMERSPHVEFDLLWASAMLGAHGRHLRDRAGKGLSDFEQLISRLCEDNRSTLEYLIDQLNVKQSGDADVEMDDSSATKLISAN